MFVFNKVWADHSTLIALGGLSFPQIRPFCLLTYPLKWKCAWSLKMIFFFIISSGRCLVKTQLTNSLRLVWSAGSSSRVNWILYACKCKLFLRIRCKKLTPMPNWWERRRIVLLGLTTTGSPATAIFSFDLWDRLRPELLMFAVDPVYSNLLTRFVIVCCGRCFSVSEDRTKFPNSFRNTLSVFIMGFNTPYPLLDCIPPHEDK